MSSTRRAALSLTLLVALVSLAVPAAGRTLPHGQPTLSFSTLRQGRRLSQASGVPLKATIWATSEQEVPALKYNGTQGSSIVILSLQGARLCYELVNLTAGLAPFAASHIHKGAFGVAGPVFIPIFGAPLAGVPYPGPKGCSPPTNVSLLEAVTNDPTGFYFNLHNANYPNGVIRGQGGMIVPFDIYGDITGSATFTFGNNYVCYTDAVTSVPIFSGKIFDADTGAVLLSFAQPDPIGPTGCLEVPGIGATLARTPHAVIEIFGKDGSVGYPVPAGSAPPPSCPKGYVLTPAGCAPVGPNPYTTKY